VEFGKGAVEDLVVHPRFWRGRRVFVTGHTGFKGAWLSLWLQRMSAVTCGYALDPPSTPSLFADACVGARMQSVHGDVLDLGALTRTMHEFQPEVVFHLAAQSLVRESYADPIRTFATNALGTANLLESVRSCDRVRVVVVVTTDKCYEEHADGAAHMEDDALGGYDPYAASKACAELVVASYRRSFLAGRGVQVASVRAGNVIGGGDWATDRIVPDLVRAFSHGRAATLRNPAATRPWQHVLDPLAGYLVLAQRLTDSGSDFAQAWNFGPAPGDPLTVADVAERFVQAWGGEAAWVVERGPQPREAPLLALDSAKARARLGWRQRLPAATAIEWTARWYRSFQAGERADALCERQIDQYMNGMIA